MDFIFEHRTALVRLVPIYHQMEVEQCWSVVSLLVAHVLATG